MTNLYHRIAALVVMSIAGTILAVYVTSGTAANGRGVCKAHPERCAPSTAPTTTTTTTTPPSTTAPTTTTTSGQLPSVAPSVVSVPTISGTPEQGDVLSMSSGSWSGTNPMSYKFQWTRCDPTGSNCGAISGANAPTYSLGSTDVTYRIRGIVTATNTAGSTVGTSTPTDVVAQPATGPSANSAPTVSGTAQTGQTLSLTTGTWSGTDPISYSYGWTRCDSAGSNCTPISGAAGQSYGLVAADVSHRIRGVVTATNAASSTVGTSDPTGVVADSAPPPPPPPPPPSQPNSYSSLIGVVGADPTLVAQKGIKNDRIDEGFLTRAKVDAATAAGVQVVPIAAYNPWSDLRPANTGDHYAPDTTARRVAWSQREMSDIVSKFSTPPVAIEVWNEPWLQGFWNQGPNPADFLDLVRQFSKVAWATPGYANVKILVSCDSGWGGWCDKLVAADTAGLLNDPRMAPTAHPYCNDRSPDSHSSTTQAQKDYDCDRYKFTYTIWKAHGAADPKVWLTEFGWVSNTPGSSPIGSEGPAVSEQLQAQYTVAMYKNALASGMVAKAYSYMLSPNQPWSYNWLRPDNSEKPVLPAVRALIG
jgi:hypothetical protein